MAPNLSDLYTGLAAAGSALAVLMFLLVLPAMLFTMRRLRRDECAS